MRYLSLFSGVEAASVAWMPLGWEPVAFAEIEPHPCDVLASRFPGVPNLGDISGIGEAEIKALGRIDLVVFGFPCTDLSVAGKRAGLKDSDGNLTRSGLFYEATRIIRLAQQHCKCRWLVAENVSGLFSSNRGRDFSEVIREITGLDFPVPGQGWRNSGVAANSNPDRWSLAWSTLDAQHFGVPQRRRRIFLVGHLGIWTHPVQVLLEPESLSGDPPPGRPARPDVASGLGGGSGSRGWCDDLDRSGAFVPDTAGSLTGSMGRRNGQPDGGDTSGHLVAAFDPRTITSAVNRSRVEPGLPCPTLCDQGMAVIGQGVRRLTPVETERLQGLPDNWTLVSHKGKSAADGPRYRAIGNSMAVPVMRWLGARIDMVSLLIGEHRS